MPFSTFLDGNDPVRLRGLPWISLSGSGQVLRGTFVSDSGGGGSVTWNSQGTVACRIDPISGRDDLVAGRVSERSTHVVTLPPNTDVGTDDRFLIDGRGTLLVTAVRDRTREWLRMIEVVET
jgi:SPP1 family predicted phage head-tail adaptor